MHWQDATFPRLHWPQVLEKWSQRRLGNEATWQDACLGSRTAGMGMESQVIFDLLFLKINVHTKGKDLWW